MEKFNSFKEFIEKKENIINTLNTIDLLEYRDYIYRYHKFSDSFNKDLIAKDKIWSYLMGYIEDETELYKTLNHIKKK